MLSRAQEDVYQIGGPDAGRDGRPYVGMMRPIMSPTEPGQLTQYGALYTGTSTQVPTHRRSSVAQSKQAILGLIISSSITIVVAGRWSLVR